MEAYSHVLKLVQVEAIACLSQQGLAAIADCIRYACLSLVRSTRSLFNRPASFVGRASPCFL